MPKQCVDLPEAYQYAIQLTQQSISDVCTAIDATMGNNYAQKNPAVICSALALHAKILSDAIQHQHLKHNP